MATARSEHEAATRRRAWVLRAAVCAAAAVAPGQAAALQTVTDGSESSGIHGLLGGFVGRFDLHRAGETDLFGGRAGVGFGELLQLTGFYWRGFDRSADSVTADNGWGGELQFNLNAGFGLTPYLVGGLARVDHAAGAAQTAALAGAGVSLPLGPVLLHAGARDYMFGVSGLADADSPDDVTHNWLYSAGFSIALGSRRPRRAVAAAPPAAGAETLAAAQLAALRDSLLADTGSVRIRTAEPSGRVDTMAGARNYQSDQRIVIPIPTEGLITLRYGPEPAVGTTPVVVTVPNASGNAMVAADSTVMAAIPPPPPGASLDDPSTRRWLEQTVAAQVSAQLSRQEAPRLTQSQIDALSQRVLDGVVATLLPRLDAANAARMNELREDLRVALREQRDDIVTARTAAPATVEQTRSIPVQPEPGTPAMNRPAPGAAPVEAREVPSPAPSEQPTVADLRDAAALRTDLAAAASAHPRFLAVVETGRGPAAVLGDAAFPGGSALAAESASGAIAAVADVMRRYPNRYVFIQGHTDARATELESQRLSEVRAEAVRTLLVRQGIDAGRIFTIGYGQARPVADNANTSGRALNRRVEIVLGADRNPGDIQ